MNYLDLYSSYPDRVIVGAWDSRVQHGDDRSWLVELLPEHGSEMFPRFAACYAHLRSLPRGARRALQRQLARSSELAAILPEYTQQSGRRLQHRMAWSLAGAALLLALGQGVATAATITVTTTNPKTKQDKKCSLIEAIVNANADAQVYRNCPAGNGVDTIVLPLNANIILTHETRKHEDTGLPVITSPITIEGNGATIARSSRKRTRPFRLIAVSETGELTLQNVTLSGGESNSGGAILNRGALVIQNSTISGNSAGIGGGVANYGTLVIENSTISGNSAADGGGLVNVGGTLTIDNSMVSENQAQNGGGVFNGNHYISTSNSAASQSLTKNGPFCSYEPPSIYGPGGTFCFYMYSGSLTIAGSIIADNSAQRHGGGITNLGAINIQNSSVTGNKAALGGGISNPPGSSIPPGTVNLLESEISDNLAYHSGGGLFNYGPLTMTNSSVSNNQAPVGPDIFP